MFGTVGIRDLTCEHGGLNVRHLCVGMKKGGEEVSSSVSRLNLFANIGL